MSKARLKLVITDLVVPRSAFRALTAAANKRYRNPITHLPFSDLLPHSLYNAGKFMTRNVR